MRRIVTRRRALIALAALALPVAFLFPRWREATRNGGQMYAEPFRIAGDLYYVGANDVAAFLLVGPAGHVLIDGGYPGTAPMIARSIAELGFDVRDVRVLLNSEPHYDHAGGLAELQRASGAALWASEASARVLAASGDDPDVALPLRALARSGLTAYPAPRVDHTFADGDTIRVGPLAVAAHVTPGHTRGCTTYTFDVRDGDRTLRVVSACSLALMQGLSWDGQDADFARTLATLRAIPADVWVTSHARLWGRWRKFSARDTAASAVAPFVDPAGYREYVDAGERRWRAGERH